LDHFGASFERLEDPRPGNAGLHDVHQLLVIAPCAVLCGGHGATHMPAFAVTNGAIALAGTQGTLHDDVRQFLDG
jgi:hypothetical protein